MALDAAFNGMVQGFAIGAASGGAGAYLQAKANGINPWWGPKSNNTVVIGRGQERVDNEANGLSTINKNSLENWGDNLEAYINNEPNPVAKQFNAKWCDLVIEHKYTVVNIGQDGKGYSPFYNGIELPRFKNYSNLYNGIPKTITITTRIEFKILIIYKK